MGLWARHLESNAEPPSRPNPGLQALERINKEAAATKPVKLARVANLLVAGKTIGEIATLLGCSPDTVTKAARDPEVVRDVKATFAERRSATVRSLDGGVLEAIRYLRDTLNDITVPTKERIRCATELLDRGGMPRGVKVDVHNAETGTTIEVPDVAALTDEEIETAARLALERRPRIQVTP